MEKFTKEELDVLGKYGFKKTKKDNRFFLNLIDRSDNTEMDFYVQKSGDSVCRFYAADPPKPGKKRTFDKISESGQGDTLADIIEFYAPCLCLHPITP